MGGSYQQEVDLLSLYKDVASDYCRWSPCPSSCPTCWTGRSASRWRGAPPPRSSSRPTCRSWSTPRPPTRSRWCPPAWASDLARAGAADADRARAADLLNAGEQGRDAGRSGRAARAEEMTQVADLLGAGVAKALLGKDVLSDELP